MPEAVGADPLGDPGAASQAAEDAGGPVAAQARSVGVEEDGAIQPLAGGQIDRPGRAGRQRDGDSLVPLR